MQKDGVEDSGGSSSRDSRRRSRTVAAASLSAGHLLPVAELARRIVEHGKDSGDDGGGSSQELLLQIVRRALPHLSDLLCSLLHSPVGITVFLPDLLNLRALAVVFTWFSSLALNSTAISSTRLLSPSATSADGCGGGGTIDIAGSTPSPTREQRISIPTGSAPAPPSVAGSYPIRRTQSSHPRRALRP
ncbi:hypothetical protein OsI_38398 [Oryza sativa Indica Group]|uniref:Uncharacterized protein n=1 Tax=Oryza sativa subsp. indica TaxID=39946 RepID=B8BPR3_ORYSI|nr:hypothetical protein OsI_38398 [Oryza sativa Indica Group]